MPFFPLKKIILVNPKRSFCFLRRCTWSSILYYILKHVGTLKYRAFVVQSFTVNTPILPSAGITTAICPFCNAIGLPYTGKKGRALVRTGKRTTTIIRIVSFTIPTARFESCFTVKTYFSLLVWYRCVFVRPDYAWLHRRSYMITQEVVLKQCSVFPQWNTIHTKISVISYFPIWWCTFRTRNWFRSVSKHYVYLELTLFLFWLVLL